MKPYLVFLVTDQGGEVIAKDPPSGFVMAPGPKAAAARLVPRLFRYLQRDGKVKVVSLESGRRWDGGSAERYYNVSMEKSVRYIYKAKES